MDTVLKDQRTAIAVLSKKAAKAARKAQKAQERALVARIKLAEVMHTHLSALGLPTGDELVAFIQFDTPPGSENQALVGDPPLADKFGNPLYVGAPVRVTGSSRFGTVIGKVISGDGDRVRIDLDVASSDRFDIDTMDDGERNELAMWAADYTASTGRVEMLTP